MDYIFDRGLVINKTDFGEADRYITVFTENYGKVNLFLKGVRKSKTKELSSVDILTISNFTLYRKNDDFKISDFSHCESFLEIKKNLEKLSYSMYVLSLLNLVLVENNSKKRLYKITEKTLFHMNKDIDEREILILLGYYLYFIVRDEGIVISKGSGENFSFEHSTFVLENNRYTFKLSTKEKEVCMLYLVNDIESLKNSEYNLKEIKKVIQLFEKYLSYHFGINISMDNYMLGGV